MSSQHIQSFIATRAVFYSTKLEFLTTIASAWEFLDMADQKVVLVLFEYFDEDDEENLVIAEQQLYYTGGLNYDDLPWKDFPTDMIMTRQYVELCIKNRKKELDLKVEETTLMVAGYASINPSAGEIIKQFEKLSDVPQDDLEFFEKKFILHQRRIFSEELLFANGVPKRVPDSIDWQSGVYRIFDSYNGVDFCQVEPDYFDCRVTMTFDDYMASCYFNKTDDSTQASISSASSTYSMLTGDVFKICKTLTENLTFFKLVDYKHQKLVRSLSQPRGVESPVPHSSSDESSEPRQDEETSSSNSGSAQKSGSPVIPELVMKWRRSESSSSPPQSFKSAESNHSNNSIAHVPQELREVEFLAEIRSQTELAKSDDWKPYWLRFEQRTFLTRSRIRESTSMATILKPKLIALFRRMDDVRHAKFFEALEEDRLTNKQRLFFLFLKKIRHNEDVHGIVYELVEYLTRK